MRKRFKKVPKFKDEDEEREFWETNDSADYIDWSKSKPIAFPNLKPTQAISIRIPESILKRVKIKASKLDIPYQALMKQYIINGIMKDK